MIRCASDDDGATRKFACFALGNAAFHSSDLHAALEPGAPPLCSCLANDSDEKARANAGRRWGISRGTAAAWPRRSSPPGAPALVAAARRARCASPRFSTCRRPRAATGFLQLRDQRRRDGGAAVKFTVPSSPG